MFVSSNGSRGARNRTVNCSSAALCLILALSHSAAVGQVAPQRTANQSEIRLAGTVVDAQGQAVGGARVVLVAPVFEYARYHWLQNLLPRATVETQTSSEGTFRLAFSRTDNRFLAARDFGLVVHHPDYQVRFESVPITRMLTDLPIDVSLERAQPVRVRVLDADNNPLASVQVAVAEQGAVTIPHAVMSEYGSATDQEGWVNAAKRRSCATAVDLCRKRRHRPPETQRHGHRQRRVSGSSAARHFVTGAISVG